MSGVGSLPHAASGAVVASGLVRVRRRGSAQSTPPPLRAPDSAVLTTPLSNVTAAPGLGPARENADACQAPDPRHC
eukprot:scaffold9601_cov123-Isochrysis_galbana.AAC.4